MMTEEHSIRTVMISSRDAKIIKIWTEKYPNPNTRYCYHFDSERLLKCVKKPLSRITLADLQAFAESLSAAFCSVELAD